MIALIAIRPIRGKNFILPGTRYMPLSGRTLFRRKFLPHPQIS